MRDIVCNSNRYHPTISQGQVKQKWRANLLKFVRIISDNYITLIICCDRKFNRMVYKGAKHFLLTLNHLKCFLILNLAYC